jgi:2-polyprenyl-6-methoxyphenol hydroxylase-like FAD-dependent oxidoreductase
MPDAVRRVLVAGGGVGGLTAATAFAQRGVEVLLIERRPTAFSTAASSKRLGLCAAVSFSFRD